MRITSAQAIIILILFPITSIMSGFTLSTLWGWFVIPVFHLPVLTIPYAIGIAYIISYCSYQIVSDDVPFEKTISFLFAKPISFLLFGWIVHLFV